MITIPEEVPLTRIEPYELKETVVCDGVEEAMKRLRLRPEFKRADIYFNDPIPEEVPLKRIETVDTKTSERSYKILPYVIKCFYELNTIDEPDYVYIPSTHPTFPVDGINLTEKYDTDILYNMMNEGVFSFKLIYYQYNSGMNYEILPSYSYYTSLYDNEKRNISRSSRVKNAIDNFGAATYGLIKDFNNPKTFLHLKVGIIQRLNDDMTVMENMKKQLQEWIDDMKNKLDPVVIVPGV